MKRIKNKIQTGLLVVMIGLSNLSFSQNNSFQKVSDKLEISEQISKFSHYRDELKMDKLLSLFTEDGIVEFINGNNEQELLWKGKKELKAGFGEWFDKARNLKVPFKGNKGITTRHIQANTIFLELTDSMAITKTAMLVTWVYNSKKTGRKNKPNTIYQGYYEDTFVKINGEWKIKSRKLVTNN